MVASIRDMTSYLVDRINAMRQAGVTFEGKRNTYTVLGYPREITALEYRARYERGGIAGRIVDVLPKATWRGGGELIEDENPEDVTEFERAWFEVSERLNIWSVLQKTDILAALGEYAVVLIGAPGELSTPLPKGKPENLLYLSPFAQDDAKIETYVTDPKDPRFGLPLKYMLKRTDINSVALTKGVHWTRVQHVADGTLDDNVCGQPRLARCWNLLDDLDKVTGGGAEAFWLRANQGMAITLDKDAELSTEQESSLKAEVEEYEHQMRRVMRLRSAKVETLGSDTANFMGPADAILKQIAGCIGIPLRILTGSEMGQLASGQDRDNWDTQVQDRRESFAGPQVVRPLVDRLIEHGYLPRPMQYDVRWPKIDNLTETEKAELATKLADVNAKNKKTVFTAAEIRDMTFAKEPLSEQDLEEDKQGVEPEPVVVLPGEEESALPRAAARKKSRLRLVALSRGSRA